MSTLKQTDLMYAVLDGEAAPGEALELERLLATDAGARAQFDQLRRLFNALASVPQAYPPEGLFASVMASAAKDVAQPDDVDQLLSTSRVFGQESKRAQGTSPGESITVRRVSQPGPFLRGTNMSEQHFASTGKRKVWIGLGIAAGALVLALFLTGNFPPSGKDAVGTIVPAQRYQAPQNTGDVIGGTSGSQSTQAGAPIQGSLDSAADSAAKNATESSARHAADSSAKDAAESSAKKAADSSAKDAAENSAKKAADSSAKSAADGAARSAADSSAKSAADGAARSAADSSAKSAADGAARSAASSSAKSAADSAAKSSADSTAR